MITKHAQKSEDQYYNDAKLRSENTGRVAGQDSKCLML